MLWNLRIWMIKSYVSIVWMCVVWVGVSYGFWRAAYLESDVFPVSLRVLVQLAGVERLYNLQSINRLWLAGVNGWLDLEVVGGGHRNVGFPINVGTIYRFWRVESWNNVHLYSFTRVSVHLLDTHFGGSERFGCVLCFLCVCSVFVFLVLAFSGAGIDKELSLPEGTAGGNNATRNKQTMQKLLMAGFSLITSVAVSHWDSFYISFTVMSGTSHFYYFILVIITSGLILNISIYIIFTNTSSIRQKAPHR